MKNAGKNLEKEKIDKPFLLDEWLDAIEELKKTSPRTYEELEEYADKEWAYYIAHELEVADGPLELISNYLDLISDKGIINAEDFKLEKRGKDIHIRISGDYSPIILRGKFFAQLIDMALTKIYDAEDQKSGNVYTIKLSPGVFTLKVALSYRTGRGSINVSDKDLGKLGMDMIENVTLVPAKKEIGIAEMMSSSSRISPGFVVMNVADANLVGVKEGDRVELIKKEAGEETEKEAGEEIKKSGEETAKEPEEEKEQDIGEEKEETTEEEKTVEKEKPQTKETQTPKKEIPKESPKPESQPKIQKQKLGIKEAKKPKIPKKQTVQDKTRQMKDFEAKIDALRNK
jgi:hypothetical protein